MKSNRSLRCYIAASPDLDTRQIEQLLYTEGIRPYEKPLMTYPTTKIVNIKDTITCSDFVLALVSLENVSQNVIFEIGVAHGLGKPVFILIQGQGPVPLELANFVYVRTQADMDSLAFSLEQFLKKNDMLSSNTGFIEGQTGFHAGVYKFRKKSNIYNAQSSESKTFSKEEKSLICPYAKELNLEKLDVIKESASILSKQNVKEAEIIGFLFDLFKKEGAIVSKYSKPGDSGADMALWIDSSANSLGNPILLEVKIGRITDSRLSSAEEQLRRYLKATNLQSGVLLYLDYEMKHFHRSRIDLPLIIRLDIRELVCRLQSESLVRILLAERNAMVHL